MQQLELDIENPDKALIALAIQEKKRREAEDGVRRYVPHIKQRAFHQSTKKIRAIFGGNRSGKSVAGCAEGAWWATGLHPHRVVPIPNFGRVCTIDLSIYLEGIILPQYKRWIPRDFLKGGSWEVAYKKEYRILYLTNGSTIEFMSYDQDAEKFGGASRHWVHEDEECPSDRHRENMMRLVDTGGSCWITMTPLKGMTWVFEDIYEKAPSKLVDSFTVDITDNPHLDPQDIEDILSTFPPDELDARMHGRFIKLSGLVYKAFHRDTHVIQPFDIPKSWPRFCAIDPHPRKADAILWLAASPNDEYYVYDELKDDSLTTIESVVTAIREKEKGLSILNRVIDTSANTPDKLAHGDDVKKTYEKLGIRTRLATKDKDAGINAVAQLLELKLMKDGRKKPRLFMFANCVKTTREMEHYIWDEYRGPNPDYVDSKQETIKRNDDLMDCLRYIIMSNPRFDPPRVYRPARKTVDSATGY